jgi:hypothetical protein
MLKELPEKVTDWPEETRMQSGLKSWVMPVSMSITRLSFAALRLS